MYRYELLAVGIYFCILLAIGVFSYRKQMSATDFIIGSRSMSPLLTALSAHASDMSSWLFMGYPALILTRGVIGVWTAVGLIGCMYLNWCLIAPKIRVATEQFNSLTFSSFFESRLADTSGLIRIFSALVLIVFYSIYLSAGLTGLGLLLETLFHLKYIVGISLGLFIVMPYVFSGGYLTLAKIDLFQGLFLMSVVLFVPLYLLPKVGGLVHISSEMQFQHLTSRLIPDFSSTTLFTILSMALGWGLGYFGQPHIVTKFMGIKRVSDLSLSKWIGMTWMVFSLGAATLVGLVGIAFFKGDLQKPELVFIEMVKESFHPFLIGFILCAILAATINAMSSLILVLSSSLAEDFYKKLIRPNSSSKELLFVSRLGVVLASLVAFMIAFGNKNTVYDLTLYSWSGIGSAFAPLVILSLYSKKINKYGAWAGILCGALTSGLWSFLDNRFALDLSPLIPGFCISFLAIIIVSRLKKRKVV